MLDVTVNTFTSEIINTTGVTLVDFWAPWCGPCRMVSPILEQIAKEQAARLRVAKVNIDENPELASNYGVMSIPTMLIFKDGEVVDEFVGALPKRAIERKLERWLG